MKTIVSLLVLLTLFSMNTFAANAPPRQKAIFKLDSFAAIHSIAFSPDSQSVASGGHGQGALLIYGTWHRRTRLKQCSHRALEMRSIV